MKILQVMTSQEMTSQSAKNNSAIQFLLQTIKNASVHCFKKTLKYEWRSIKKKQKQMLSDEKYFVHVSTLRNFLDQYVLIFYSIKFEKCQIFKKIYFTFLLHYLTL